ncbi:MAG: hypothetical protein ACXAC5_04000 [Promethearchaeota archaeon]|jgi:hypothetical protein
MSETVHIRIDVKVPSFVARVLKSVLGKLFSIETVEPCCEACGAPLNDQCGCWGH